MTEDHKYRRISKIHPQRNPQKESISHLFYATLLCFFASPLQKAGYGLEDESTQLPHETGRELVLQVFQVQVHKTFSCSLDLVIVPRVGVLCWREQATAGNRCK